jgi:2-amino-4-hydroxy-6-hydroxymethyldihydropteridine diphosphokinase
MVQAGRRPSIFYAQTIYQQLPDFEFTGEHSMVDCLIAFGANEGDLEKSFRLAVQSLRSIEQIEVTAVGDPEKTAAVGGPDDQPQYLNAAIRLKTILSADSLHQRLLEIEAKLGRERRVRWGSRKIDLDLLLYGDQTIETETLTIPHPRMSFRRFVLEPCLKIAGDMTHPVSGKSIAQLLDLLDHRADVAGLVNAPSELLNALTLNGGIENWTFVQIFNADQLTELESIAKLIIILDGNPESNDVVDQALNFAGPMLDARSMEEPADEVVAAITAASVTA